MTCPTCKGKKNVNYLVSIHNDETSLGPCNNCDGKGFIYEANNGDDYLFCYW